MAEVQTKLAFEGSVFTHQVGEVVHTLDLTAMVPGYDSLPDVAKSALQFAIKTASRNATAGKLADEAAIKEANEAIATRHKAWLEGKWAARRESTGEAQTSALVQALVELSGGEFTASDIAETISNLIDSAVDTAGLDRDSDDAETKKKIRQVGSAVRKQFKDDEVVAAKIKAIEANRALEASTKADEKAAGKVSGVMDMFKR